MIGIYAGRFQPFHLGHLGAIDYISKYSDKMHIIICSRQVEHPLDDKNPFTFEERRDMMVNSLSRDLLDNIRFSHVRDARNDKEWVDTVKIDIEEEDDVISYSNNPMTIKAFEDHGFRTSSIPTQYQNLNATFIRKRIIRGEPYDTYIPDGTMEIIRRVRNGN